MMKPAVTMKKLLALLLYLSPLYTSMQDFSWLASYILQWQCGIPMQRFLFQYICIDMPYTNYFNGWKVTKFALLTCNFQKFSGGMPPDPPRISLLRVFCTPVCDAHRYLATYLQIVHIATPVALMSAASFTNGNPITKILQTPLVYKCQGYQCNNY